MAGEQFNSSPQSRFSPEQKIGFILLLVFSFLCVGLGILRIRHTFYSPFALNRTIPSTIKEEFNSVELLRFRDTDRDGLNDFDEQFVYRTSPYLADTDSDGMTDKQELDKREDPLCAGKTCAGPELDENEALKRLAPASTTLVSANENLENPEIDIAQVLSDPSQLRQMLITAGADKKQLDKVDDMTLLSMLGQMLTSSTVFTNETLQSFVNATRKP